VGSLLADMVLALHLLVAAFITAGLGIYLTVT
jgi:hypothetical protein